MQCRALRRHCLLDFASSCALRAVLEAKAVMMQHNIGVGFRVKGFSRILLTSSF